MIDERVIYDKLITKLNIGWYVRRGNCHIKIIKTFAKKSEGFCVLRGDYV